ncbi:MAG: esterase family protein [Pyrinomonadaceae bacterium]|nr:esterase family protein [Pyrinomonadaceae bacterium]
MNRKERNVCLWKLLCGTLLFAALSFFDLFEAATAQTQRPAKAQTVATQPRKTQTSSAASNEALREARRETLAASSLGGKPLPYRVLLPTEYATSMRRYPVLYLLHGRTGDENDWWTKTNLVQYAARHRLIIVMPGVGDSWYANSATNEQAKYEDAMMRDLIPHIDKSFRTLATWHGRAIAGLSMGGLGAMKFALRFPDMFAFAASFSGAFDVPRTVGFNDANDQRIKDILGAYGPKDSPTRQANDVFLLLERITPERRARMPYLYVATGANDPLPSVVSSNPRFADALRERKFQYEYHERPGGHDWRFWDEEVKSMLERMADFIPQSNP